MAGGGGSSADPWIIETWGEFKAGWLTKDWGHRYSGDSYFKIKDNTVWDLNELEPSGNCPQININTGEYINANITLDGNGCIIKNIRLRDNPFFYLGSGGKNYTVTFKNFRFENIYGQNNLIMLGNFGTSDSSPVLINDCIITGFFTQPVLQLNGDGGMANYRRFILSRCGVHIDLLGRITFAGRSTFKFVDSYIKLKWYDNFSSGYLKSCLGEVNTNYKYSTYPKFNNSFVDLDLKNNTNSSTSIYFSVNTDSNNSIYNIKMNTGSIIIDSNESFNLINSETIGSGVSTSDLAKFEKLTTAQLKDPNYIRSKGFPIGGE